MNRHLARLQDRFDTLASALLASAFALTLAGCADGNDSRTVDTRPFAELYEQGILRYLGVYTPMLSEVDGAVTTHTFGVGDGPMCQLGAPYSMSTRDQGSDNLLIFLEGGGACWSELCLSTEEIEVANSSAGINDPGRANNPARDWNQVYLPYCDGSLHAGDSDADYDNDGVPERFHRGLHNLSAALDVAANTFPAPARIILAGNSGGGFGTIFALPLVRAVYPDARIDVLNDSGVGVGTPDDPSLLLTLQEDWNLDAFLPASCADCIADDGHFTNYMIWQLEQDPDTRLSLLSYTQDFVIANTFVRIGGPAFEAALREQMQRQEDAHPQRVRSFLPAGSSHTFLQLEPDKTIDGVNLMDWISAMLEDSPDWVSLTE